MREIFARQVLPAVKSITGGRGAGQRAALVASQLLGMALCRYILRLPPMVSMPREMLVKEVGRTIQRYATGEEHNGELDDRQQTAIDPGRGRSCWPGAGIAAWRMPMSMREFDRRSSPR